MNPSSPPVASSPAPAMSMSVRATASTRMSSSFSPPANFTPNHHSNSNTHPITHKQTSPSLRNNQSQQQQQQQQQHQSQNQNQNQQDNKSPSSPRHPQPRIVYGKGIVARLPAELGLLCITSPLIVSSPSRLSIARRVQALIPNLNSHILDSAVINVPDRVVDDAVERISGRDAVISVGGSSAVGLARAISIRKGIPHICIPTNYSGFEVMPLFEEDAASLAGNAGSVAPRSTSSKQSSGKNSLGKRTGGDSSGKHSSTRTTTGSKASSRRSVTIRDARSRITPAVIIYDEDLTALSSRRILAPTDDIALPMNSTARSRRFSEDDAEWSFLQLP